MRKIFLFTLTVFLYNFFLLVLPILIFIISLSFTGKGLLNIFPWIYSPFVLISPILSIILGYLVIKDNLNLFTGTVPIIMALIGNMPFLCIYYLFNPFFSLLDLFLLIGLPILFGILSDLTHLGVKYLQPLIRY
jgi:hypothetical protein